MDHTKGPWQVHFRGTFEVSNYQNMPTKIDLKGNFTSKKASYSLEKDFPSSCPDSILINSEKDADNEDLF